MNEDQDAGTLEAEAVEAGVVRPLPTRDSRVPTSLPHLFSSRALHVYAEDLTGVRHPS